ncbi:uncharacterized protein BXZ73DRAFT_105530 [Epithele typhae]|uniref:uncharacterized protein n=1 Tax=Epithele typhae TaxID=378194 RepID=UPI002008DDA2|nr:uncharacterized protein BXZ73DRAFT_105530 [Epithele typhae]KAH9917368.1 hypothetical protein BXZ73DRAFT_105530 [Epithele typhae]
MPEVKIRLEEQEFIAQQLADPEVQATLQQRGTYGVQTTVRDILLTRYMTRFNHLLPGEPEQVYLERQKRQRGRGKPRRQAETEAEMKDRMTMAGSRILNHIKAWVRKNVPVGDASTASAESATAPVGDLKREAAPRLGAYREFLNSDHPDVPQMDVTLSRPERMAKFNREGRRAFKNLGEEDRAFLERQVEKKRQAVASNDRLDELRRQLYVVQLRSTHQAKMKGWQRMTGCVGLSMIGGLDETGQLFISVATTGKDPTGRSFPAALQDSLDVQPTRLESEFAHWVHRIFDPASVENGTSSSAKPNTRAIIPKLNMVIPAGSKTSTNTQKARAQAKAFTSKPSARAKRQAKMPVAACDPKEAACEDAAGSSAAPDDGDRNTAQDAAVTADGAEPGKHNTQGQTKRSASMRSSGFPVKAPWGERGPQTQIGQPRLETENHIICPTRPSTAFFFLARVAAVNRFRTLLLPAQGSPSSQYSQALKELCWLGLEHRLPPELVNYSEPDAAGQMGISCDARTGQGDETCGPRRIAPRNPVPEDQLAAIEAQREADRLTKVSKAAVQNLANTPVKSKGKGKDSPLIDFPSSASLSPVLTQKYTKPAIDKGKAKANMKSRAPSPVVWVPSSTSTTPEQLEADALLARSLSQDEVFPPDTTQNDAALARSLQDLLDNGGIVDDDEVPPWKARQRPGRASAACRSPSVDDSPSVLAAARRKLTQSRKPVKESPLKGLLSISDSDNGDELFAFAESDDDTPSDLASQNQGSNKENSGPYSKGLARDGDMVTTTSGKRRYSVISLSSDDENDGPPPLKTVKIKEEPTEHVLRDLQEVATTPSTSRPLTGQGPGLHPRSLRCLAQAPSADTNTLLPAIEGVRDLRPWLVGSEVVNSWVLKPPGRGAVAGPSRGPRTLFLRDDYTGASANAAEVQAAVKGISPTLLAAFVGRCLPQAAHALRPFDMKLDKANEDIPWGDKPWVLTTKIYVEDDEGPLHRMQGVASKVTDIIAMDIFSLSDIMGAYGCAKFQLGHKQCSGETTWEPRDLFDTINIGWPKVTTIVLALPHVTLENIII